MKRSKILNEQIDITRDCTKFQTDGKLNLACQSGCLPNNAEARIINGILAAVAQGAGGKYGALFGDYVDGVGGTMLISDTIDDFSKAIKKTWVCDKMQQVVNASIDPETKKVIEQIKTATNNEVIDYEAGMNNKNLILEGWELVPLTKAPFYNQVESVIGPRLGARANMVVVWVKKTRKQYTGSDANRIISRYEEKKYVSGKPPGGIDEPGYFVVDLQVLYPNEFKEPYWMYYDVRQANDDTTIALLRKSVEESKISGREKSACRNLIKLYVQAYDKKLDLDQITLNTFKPALVNCINNYKYPFLSKKIESLRIVNPITTMSNKSLDYSWDPRKQSAQKVTQVRENTDSRVAKILRESLIKIGEVKKKLSAKKGY